MMISLRLIKWYQTTVSPMFPARCKYYPTCSAYAATAIRRFGFFRGGLLGLIRLLRCQPWNKGGIDDVPEKFSVFYRLNQAHQSRRNEAEEFGKRGINKAVSGFTLHKGAGE